MTAALTNQLPRWMVLGATVVLAATSCSSSSDNPNASSGSTTTTTSAVATCEERPDENAAKRVRRCAEKSIAYVETSLATGTGIVIDHDAKRYVLTNLHVVDPFGAAKVTIDGSVNDDLPVVGVDVLADIAVLGPLEGQPAPLAIADGTGLEKGDDVYLLGFPGETEKSGDPDLQPTMASGIVSRIRSVKEFDQTYIQTDASIAGGQSGGPLLDDMGRVVGVSGLSFAQDQFALALAGRNLNQSVERILRGDGDEKYSALPVSGTDGATTSGSVKLIDGAESQVLYVPAANEKRTLNFTVDPKVRPVVQIGDPSGDAPLAETLESPDIVNELDRRVTAAQGADAFPDITFPDVASDIRDRQVAPGSWKVPIPRDTPLVITIGAPLIDAPTEVAWTSDIPAYAASRPVETLTAKVGDVIDRVFGSYDTSVDVLVDLTAGSDVELSARSPQGDVAFAVVPPGLAMDAVAASSPVASGVEQFDDTDDGLFGVDAKTTYTPKTTGTYRIRIYMNDGVTSGFRFSSTACGSSGCDGADPTTTTTRAV